MTNTVTLHRVLTAPLEKVFRAFSDANAYASWIPPYGFYCTVEKFDFKKDGEYHASFTNFTTGKSSSFGGKILELKTNELIKYTDKFDNPTMPGQMITTITLHKVLCGTEINIKQEGIPDMIPPEMCYLGWQESLEKLKKLVEPNIPDN